MKELLLKFCQIWSDWNVNDTKQLIAFAPFVLYWLYKKQYEKIERYVVAITLCLVFHIALKGFLKIPHPVHTNTFAFPSGRVYMFMAIMVALCMELMSRNKAIIVSLSLTLIEGFLTTFNQHHVLIDSVGSFIICGIELLLIYFAFSKIGTEFLLKVNIIAPLLTIVLLFPSTLEYMTKHRERFLIYAGCNLVLYLFKKYRQGELTIANILCINNTKKKKK